MGLSRPPQKTGAYCTEGISTYDRVLMFFVFHAEKIFKTPTNQRPGAAVQKDRSLRNVWVGPFPPGLWTATLRGRFATSRRGISGTFSTSATSRILLIWAVLRPKMCLVA